MFNISYFIFFIYIFYFNKSIHVQSFYNWPLHYLYKERETRRNNTKGIDNGIDIINKNENENENNNKNDKNMNKKKMASDLYNGECILPIEFNSFSKGNKGNGYDYRYNNTNLSYKEELLVLKGNFLKKGLLNLLINENISDVYKLEILEKYSYIFNYPNKYVSNNIYHGLWDQW